MIRTAPFRLLGWLIAAVLLAAGPAAADDPAAPSADDAAFFESEIRPLLADKCWGCHGREKTKGGLTLTSRAALLNGGDSGPAAEPGRPTESLLIDAIAYVDEPKMPPDGKLSDSEIAALTQWVERGLPWPGSAEPSAEATAPVAAIDPAARNFWSLRPIADPAPPVVRNESWPRSDLDRFLLAKLEAAGRSPAPPADRRTLIRRATFDLIGLPPTPEEVEAFVGDARTDDEAFAAVVDRLLASPRYGERWGRHWLDLMRYADSHDARIAGQDNVMDINDAWRYRDWVIGAFNRDLPYDRFVQMQVAGDLLPTDPPGEVNVEGIVATGALAIGNWGGGDADKEKLLTDIADDQVDLVGRAFLGLTIACARCHDHKFDPIAQRDYYALAGIFFSSHILPDVGPKTNGPPMLRIPLETKARQAERAAHDEKSKALDARFATSRDRHARALAIARRPESGRYVAAALGAESAEGLDLALVARWQAALGLGSGRLLDKPSPAVLGRAGVVGWVGDGVMASLTVNTNPAAETLLTFTLPARSVSVHPGPRSAAVVEWTSPVAGRVALNGRLADGDPVGGNGVTWALDHRRLAGTTRLAGGDLANGGASDLIAEAELAVGDRLRLTVDPKGEYSFDTTTVALTVAAADGTTVADLTTDLLREPLAGNPHADSAGRAGAWRFEDAGPLAADPAAEPVRALWTQVAPSGSEIGPAELARAATEFAARFDLEDARSPFWPGTEADEAALPTEARAELAGLRSELAAHQATAPPPVEFAQGVQEGGVPESPHAGVHDVKIHIRGSYSRLGPVVPRGFPGVLASADDPTIGPGGSGRLELAEWLTRPGNPLVARVMANRLWQHHFGEGLVRTPGNFGKLGEAPDAPELLDWLATRLVENGWSLKTMHREIMRSSAYRQSSVAAPGDPENRLFGRQNRRRLEAEALRDALLIVAGRLDPAMGGPAVRDLANPRRSVYLMTIRSERSGFGPLFDAADPTAIVDRRGSSTVAPQALFLLNSPMALDLAGAFAERVLEGPAADPRTRIARAYTLAYGRPPTADEVAIGLELVGDAGDERAWTEYAQVLLCANEFLYID